MRNDAQSEVTTLRARLTEAADVLGRTQDTLAAREATIAELQRKSSRLKKKVRVALVGAIWVLCNHPPYLCHLPHAQVHKLKTETQDTDQVRQLREQLAQSAQFAQEQYDARVVAEHTV